MALPNSWPPRPATGVRSIRFYATGTGTANFSDNAFMWAESSSSANTFMPTPVVPAGGEATQAKVGDLTKSGSPMGGGRSSTDANSDPRAGVIAPPPRTQIWGRGLRIVNASANLLEFSFDGTNVHGVVLANSTATYTERFESGVAIRITAGGTFHVEAW